jgi:plasmid stabilization system protein ParE
MSLPIHWSEEAEDTFDDIITHLELNWSEKEVRKFFRTTRDVLKQISLFPLDVQGFQIKKGNTQRISHKTMLFVL